MKTVRTHTGAELPGLGQGTWTMGANAGTRKKEVEALQLGIDLGMTLVDTAEMYASGGAEEVTGEAIASRRDEVYLVSKILPQNATREGTVEAAEKSLARLGTDRIDLYLLHWRGPHPLEETVAGMEELRESGKIVDWGASNFDISDLEELFAVAGGDRCAANQVLYAVRRRFMEWSIAPWCRERGVAIMAYSPLEQGRTWDKRALAGVAARHDATPEQIAIAWSMRDESVVTIPKASSQDHVRQNAATAEIVLTEEDLAEIDAAFPPPSGPAPLETL